MNNNGLYIHIPFCITKCIYCNFVSFKKNEGDCNDYLQALFYEMQLRKESVKDRIFDSLYIGGGTPGVLSVFQLEEVFKKIKECFNVAPNSEITFETNPKTLTKDKIEVLKNNGVNRVSLGLQSINEQTLRVLGRQYNLEEFVKSIKLLQSSNLTNISADILIGLPQQNKDGLCKTVDLLFDLGLKHVSAYGLKVERGTPLTKMVAKGSIVLPNEDEAVDLYGYAFEKLESRGFYRYEVSNFANKGFECLHNINCWKVKEYLGLGLGSHSYMFGKRFSNVKTLSKYCSKINKGTLPISQSVKIGFDEQIKERVMLGLRLEEGIRLDELEKDFKINFFEYFTNSKKLISMGYCLHKDNKYSICKDKFYVMNYILGELLD